MTVILLRHGRSTSNTAHTLAGRFAVREAVAARQAVLRDT